MSIDAFYFSGTGNTKDVMRMLGGAFVREGVPFKLHEITADTDYTGTISKADTVCVAFPVYWSKPPQCVSGFLDRYENVWLDKDVIVIAVKARPDGDAAAYVARRLKKAGAVVRFAEHILMPDNRTDGFFAGLRARKDNDRSPERAGRKLDKFVEDYIYGREHVHGRDPWSRLTGAWQRLWFGRRRRKLAGGVKISLSQCNYCLQCLPGQKPRRRGRARQGENSLPALLPLRQPVPEMRDFYSIQTKTAPASLNRVCRLSACPGDGVCDN